MTTELRIAAALPRSGSTLFMRIMATHPSVKVTSRTVLMGNVPPGRRKHNIASGISFRPDYRIYNGPLSSDPHPVWKAFQRTGRSVLISKEETGYNVLHGSTHLNECNYRIFPDKNSIFMTRPIFIFRNPISCFDSWKAQGWLDIESFLVAYHSLKEQFYSARVVIKDTPVLVYDKTIRSVASAAKHYQIVCNHWGLHYKIRFNFDREFGSDFLFWSHRERENYTGKRLYKLFSSVRSNNVLCSDIAEHGLLTALEKDIIIQELGDTYEDLVSLAEEQEL